MPAKRLTDVEALTRNPYRLTDEEAEQLIIANTTVACSPENTAALNKFNAIYNSPSRVKQRAVELRKRKRAVATMAKSMRRGWDEMVLQLINDHFCEKAHAAAKTN